MARIHNPTPEQEAGYHEFLNSRPPAVRAVAEHFDPWSLYRINSTGHRVTIHSFAEGENGTVTLTVDVTAQYNLVSFERRVFGIARATLEPCDPPGPDEVTRAAMTQEQIEQNLDELRVRIRPDLWTTGPDGKAIPRK